MAIQTFCDLFDDYVRSGPLSFMLTYKFSQAGQTKLVYVGLFNFFIL